MSAATVRAAIKAFLAPPAVTGLNKVYLDEPWFAPGNASAPEIQGGWGAYAFVHLETQDESRITLPALTGSKDVEYDVGLVVIFDYLKATQTTAQDNDAWVLAHDELLDGIVTRLRSDPTLGNSSVVFEAGQANQGIRIRRDLPRLDHQKLRVWSVVEFKLTEIVTA